MTDGWRASPAKRAQVALIAGVGYPVLAALGRTLRWRVEGHQHVDAVRASGRQPVMAFWHGRILPAGLFFRHQGYVVMASENFDGEWIARIVERLGYGTVRGSTTRGGGRAMRQMLRELRAGRSPAFTVDGPRGPARVAQPGAAWLAAATGSPLVPFHMEASSSWQVPSWDRTEIPKPFSTVGLVIGAPIEVARDTSEGAVAALSLELGRRLAALEAPARALAGVARGARAG